MEIKARVPGVVNEINVSVGDKVVVKQPLMVMEAMKMMQPVLSPVDGEVTEVLVEEGQRVSGGFVLVIIE